MIATEPLSPERLAADRLARPGGGGGHPQPDPLLPAHARQPAADGRRPGRPRLRARHGARLDPAAWAHLEHHVRAVPLAAGARITHRWGGPFSVTSDLTPSIGHARRLARRLLVGCVGHGVSMTHLNGQTIRDLVLGRSTELTETSSSTAGWSRGRRSRSASPSPGRCAACSAPRTAGASGRKPDAATSQEAKVITRRLGSPPARSLGHRAGGCMGMSDLYGPADEAESIATIHAALDAGDHPARHRRLLRHGRTTSC